MTSPPSDLTADVVVVGAGAAGLSLAWRLAARPGVVPSVTLVEPPPGPVRSPERTWCFWEEEGGDFDDLLTASWSRMRVTARDGRTVTGEMPLPYKMLRSSRFIGELDARLERAPGVHRLTGTVTEIVDTPGGARVGGRDAGGRPFTLDARQVYDTRPPRRLPRARTTLLQHFRGWFVRTEQDRFDPGVAELMDLRVPQPPRGVAFVYVLPFGARTALIEYTQFTTAPLDDDGYEAALRHYTEVVRPLGAFTVTGAEQGLIPMTDGVFPRRTGRAVFPLGVAGGAVRPATGYAFAAIQRQTSALAAAHREGRMALPPRPHARRHLAMDAVMLRALAAGHVEGARFFEVLFARNPLPRVVGFLSGRTSLAEDLALGARCPVPPMVRSVAELPFLPRRACDLPRFPAAEPSGSGAVREPRPNR
jgi:lycopene beta-cyclase